MSQLNVYATGHRAPASIPFRKRRQSEFEIVYLASPYKPLNGESVEVRVAAVCKAAAKLIQDGRVVFCPIAHSHAITQHMPREAQFDHALWMRQDLSLLRMCDSLIVLMLPGWKESLGVQRECETARRMGMSIEFMEPLA